MSNATLPGFEDAAASDAAVLEALLGEPAAAVIAEFGDLTNAVAAPIEQLTNLVGGSNARRIKLLAIAGARILRGELAQRCVLSSWTAVLDYLRASLRSEPKEQFRAIFLDKKNQIITDDLMGVGTVDHVPVYPREVIARALAVHATAVILVHNHPSGDPTPSAADIAMTKEIITAGKPLGVRVHDHVIVGANSNVSMRGMGLI